MVHITIRMAWHDNKWNGRICENPDGNIHCIGDYSLLSPRIQRRIRLDIERDYANEKISKTLQEHEYIPPCYWSINALGNEEYFTTDYHPFADAGRSKERFMKEVPPIAEDLKAHSVFTWYFRLGYAKEGSLDRYVPREELESRVQEYLKAIREGQSIGLLYANYSNPITGDDRKYLLLGAGLISEVFEPKKFDVPEDLFNYIIRSSRSMRNMPRMAWRFQVVFDPSTLFVLPYHEYLQYIEDNGSVDDEGWRMLKEAAVSIDEDSIVRNFKYVCRPISSDKCLHTLYLLDKSLRNMKEHGIVEHSQIKEMKAKLASLFEIAWQERGRYPGFRNLIKKLLSTTYPPSMQGQFAEEIHALIEKDFGGLKEFMQVTLLDNDYKKIPIPLRRAFKIVERKKSQVEFLSRFDFSKTQFENVQDIIDRVGFETAMKNPYILLESYIYGTKDHWRIDESDFGLGLFHIDMALIPDPRYADWGEHYEALSPERLRAVIAKILHDKAMHDGISYLTREEIVDCIKEYPLYYIHEGLKVDVQTLLEYEKQALFKEKFSIKQEFPKQEVLYQLKTIRDIERTIEQFIEKMSNEKYGIDKADIQEIETIIGKETEIFKEKLDVNERRALYRNALGNGLFVLTGKAGSGKTTAVRNLVEKFKDDKKIPIFIFTPTGKASLVIKDRLKDLDYEEAQIRVSTIHRFLFTAPFEYRDTFRWREIYALRNLIEKILDGKLELLNDFKSLAKDFKFNPKIVIIDEISMVDEVLLALLFTLISSDTLDHLILVGDEKQLPPIGIGRPLADTVFNLKKNGLDSNLIHLESNLRFPVDTSLGNLSDLLGGDDMPTLADFQEILEDPDETIRSDCFSNREGLRDVIENIVHKVGNVDTSKSIFEMFEEVFEGADGPDLDRIQILTPRKMGAFGSEGINVKTILDDKPRFLPGTKLICEENMYYTIGRKRNRRRILGLANGSIGYIEAYRDIFFDDVEDLVKEYGDHEIRGLKQGIVNEIYNPLKSQKRINLGYAITVHKSQGSDFLHVIFVLSDISPFITKELLYTALTRPKEKLYLVTHKDLEKRLPSILSNAYVNSEVEKRKTLLFGHKESPFKPYYLAKKNGETIQVMSKIEYIIAKVLDEKDIEFEPGPKEFLRDYRLVPDFKLSINGKNYYWEHLGNMRNLSYRERWYRKLKIYREEIGIAENLVTTSESETRTDTEKAIREVISDLESGKLAKTEGAYSDHHYYI